MIDVAWLAVRTEGVPMCVLSGQGRAIDPAYGLAAVRAEVETRFLVVSA